jgi:hypothetical protein
MEAAIDQVVTENDSMIVVTDGSLIDEPSVMISVHVNGGSAWLNLTETEALKVRRLIDDALENPRRVREED